MSLVALKERAQGRPGARCTRGLVCTFVHQKTHTSIQVQRRHSGLPCAMVLTVSFMLSPVTGFLSPSPAESYSANLTPASGRQDHTTSPYASMHSSARHLIAPALKASIASRALRP
jgi:hypothetical protein